MVNLSSLLLLLESILSQVDSFLPLCFLMGWPHPPHLPPTTFIPCKTAVDCVTHNYQKQRPIITFPSHCASTNFKTQEVLVLLPNYILWEGSRQAGVKI